MCIYIIMYIYNIHIIYMYIYIHIYNLLCSSLFGNKFYFILNKESNKLLEQTCGYKKKNK